MNATFAGIGLAFVLLGAGFVLSGTETALFSLQKVQRQRMRKGNAAEQRAVGLLDRRTDTLTTLSIGTQSVTIGLTTLCAAALTRLDPTRPWLTVALLTPLLVLFTGVTPKVLAIRYNLLWARSVSMGLWLFILALWPLRVLVGAVVRGAARIAQVPDHITEDRLQEDDLRDLLEQQSGELGEHERDIVEAVFDFDDLVVGRLMTPRPDIFALPLNTPWKEALERCRDADFSRVPIYRNRVEDLVGVLLLKDLLRFRKDPPATLKELQRLLLPPVYVPASKPASDMLREFLEKKGHISLVVDEHGTLVGLVTLDDLLSELLDHETDEEVGIQSHEDGRFTVKAWVDVDDFTEEIGLRLPEGEYNTVGGFVFHLLGRLPQPGDTVSAEGHQFEITLVEGRRIVEVMVRQPGAIEASA